MAYYKFRIEGWCNSDPSEMSQEEVLRGLLRGQDAICIRLDVLAVEDRPQDIEDDEAMSFFGGEEGDANESQG
jgi:hypothetical protein